MLRMFLWMGFREDWRKLCVFGGDLRRGLEVMVDIIGGYYSLSVRENFCGWKFVVYFRLERFFLVIGCCVFFLFLNCVKIVRFF